MLLSPETPAFKAAPDDFEFLREGPAGYPYGTITDIDATGTEYDTGIDVFAIPEELQEEEIFKTELVKASLILLLGLFVISSGRQDKQFCDQVAGVIQMIEEGADIDTEIMQHPLVIHLLRSWDRVPQWHTKAPEKVDGQVVGVMGFWGDAQGDALAFASGKEGFQLPNRRQLAKRYAAHGVKPLGTSSTTTDERNTIIVAFEDIANDPDTLNGSLDEFILYHCLRPHLEGVVHYSNFLRKRTDKMGDKNEPKWVSAMKHAVDKDPEARNIYDRLLVRQAQTLKTLLSMTKQELEQDERLLDLRALHDYAVDELNAARELARNQGRKWATDAGDAQTLLDDIPVRARFGRQIIHLPPDALLGAVI